MLPGSRSGQHDTLERLPQDDDGVFIAAAFELLIGSAPTTEEDAACRQALTAWRQLLEKQPDREVRARGNLVQALVNHNDFVTIR